MNGPLLTLYYDEACPRCCRWARILKRVGGRRLQFLMLRKDGRHHPLINMKKGLISLPAVHPSGQVSYGFDALLAVSKHVWWLWPLWPGGVILQHTGWGAWGYAYLSLRRKILHCTTTLDENNTNC